MLANHLAYNNSTTVIVDFSKLVMKYTISVFSGIANTTFAVLYDTNFQFKHHNFFRSLASFNLAEKVIFSIRDFKTLLFYSINLFFSLSSTKLTELKCKTWEVGWHQLSHQIYVIIGCHPSGLSLASPPEQPQDICFSFCDFSF